MNICIKKMNMNNKTFFTILFLMYGFGCYSQIIIKTEYLGASQYWHEVNEDSREKVGSSKGSVMIYQVDIKLPLYTKMSADSSKSTIWGLAVGGAYAHLNNKDFADYMVSEIMNFQMGVFYIKPISTKWSSLTMIGGGIFTPSANPSKINYENILGNVGTVFIRHFKPNLDLGGGLALNSTLGYPMVFPAIYFNWSFEHSFDLNVSLMTGFEIKAGYQFNKHYKLNLLMEVNGQLALLEKDNKDVMFTHQYFIIGLSPEIRINKHSTFSFTVGINAMRPAYFNERSLKGILVDDQGYYYGLSLYASTSITIK